MANPYTPGNVREPGPAVTPYSVTPDDTNPLPYPIRGFYVGVTGNVVVNGALGDVTFVAIPAGSIMPVQAIKIKNTGTTASSIVGLI